MSTNNNEYLNSLRTLNNIITNLNDDKIKGFGTKPFTEFNDNPPVSSLLEKIKYDNTLNVSIVNKKQKDVLNTIGDMKKKLSDSNNENKQFMDILSKNLQYYNTVVVNIIDKINQIFNLIKSLDITKGNLSIGQPGPDSPEPPNRRGQSGQNDELIKELVDTINKYLNEFNILKSNIDTVVGNNHILREELSKKSNDLFGNIKKLDDLFVTKFNELGIFGIGGSLFTYKQLQNKLLKINTRNNTQLKFVKEIFLHKSPYSHQPNEYTIIGYDKDRYNYILDNLNKLSNDEKNELLSVTIGGSKRIKNRKTKRRKPKRKSVKRKKTKYFQTIL